jgi:hypothetical protein
MEKLEKFERSVEKLDEILSNQRSPTNKTRLGYNNSLKTIGKDKKRTRKMKEDLETMQIP